MSREIGVAVVGCGYWGPNLVRNLSVITECTVRTVCDTDAERVRAICRRYPAVRGASDVRDVLCDPTIDAVALATPVSTHYPLARAALEAGKHVLVEKPFTHSSETAAELIDLAAARGLVIQVDLPFVYGGAVQKIRGLIERGEVGELLYFDSVRVNLGLFQSDVNVVWDLATHDLSIMLYLVQRMPRSVSAVGMAHYGPLEDIAYLTMRFDDALIGHVHVNWLAPVKLRSVLIGGSQRMVVYDDLEPSEQVRVYEKGVTLGNGNGAARTRALVDYRVGDMWAPHIDKTEPLSLVCRDFIGAIMDGRRPLADADLGLRIVRILEAAQRSIERGGEWIDP
jgi:predicted dehydrogenase